MIPAILAAVLLAAAFAAGWLLCQRRLTRRVEAMHAAMTATRVDAGPHRQAVADRYRDQWRHAVRFHGRGWVA